VRYEAIVRQVDRDDPSMWDQGPDGRQVFMGRPLREFLDMADSDGTIRLPMPTGLSIPGGEPPQVVLRTDDVEDGTALQQVGPDTVRVSLRKWLHRDPDRTFLQIAWRFQPTNDAERAALEAANPTDVGRQAFD
jgi:hypothetical protein